MKKALAVTFCFAAVCSGQVVAQPPQGEAQFRALFRDMVETDTSFVSGDCTALVTKVAARMKAAGFPEKNLHIFAPPGKAKDGNLVATLPGEYPQAKAILMLGHIDVVNALKEDWPRDPYLLVEENGQFYGRGVSDMKAQDAIWADIMLRFHQEGYKPRRGVKMALTCGEEGGGFINGAGWLAQNQRELIDAKFALTEGGGGELDADGKKVAVTVMRRAAPISCLRRGGRAATRRGRRTPTPFSTWPTHWKSSRASNSRPVSMRPTAPISAAWPRSSAGRLARP
jgi:acetylornithine deacetylase/succinyl-diaminopimelate desuccinylase-like protein